MRKTKQKQSCKKDYEAFMFEADIKTDRKLEEVIEEKPSEKKKKTSNVKTKIQISS